MDAPRLTLRTPCSPLLAISSLEHEKVRVPKHAHPGAVGRSVRPLTLLRPAVAGACWLDATIELNPMRTVEVAEAVLVLVAQPALGIVATHAWAAASRSARPRQPLSSCPRTSIQSRHLVYVTFR